MTPLQALTLVAAALVTTAVADLWLRHPWDIAVRAAWMAGWAVCFWRVWVRERVG